MTERSALVVEDSPTMRQLIALTLRRIPALGFAEASNGAEALGLLATRRFDLILLDINMPVMNGFAFLEQLRQTEAPPPVIVISTESAREDIERAISLGAVAYVTKPVRGPDLAATVGRVLQQYAPAP